MIRFEKGTEVVIENEVIGIVTSDGPIVFNETKHYLVQTSNQVVKVFHEQIISSKEWAKRKLLATCDESLFWRKMLHKKTSNILFCHLHLIMFS